MEREKIQLKQKTKKKTYSKFISLGITSGLVILLSILLYFYFHYYFLGGRIISYVEKKEIITILFLGLDEIKNEEKTDTIIIGIYNPSTKRFGLITVPRDMKVEIEEKIGQKTLKINSVYSKYNIKKLFEVINRLTGLDMKFYTSIKISDMIKIVDLINGVDIYVEKPMKYTDRNAGLYIELPKGMIRCDGLKAMEFIRYRSDERGDMGRIERQYEFILNLIKKAVIKKNILMNLKLLKIMFKKIKTNLNFSDMINLIKYSSTADFSSIETVKLPGKFVNIYGVKYIQPDISKTKKVAKSLLNKLTYTKTDYTPQEIKVQVLNGSGKRGIAKRIRDKLVRNGFNVIEFGNADYQNYEQTIVLDRTGNMKKALKVAQILKCKNVFPKINKFIMLDVTVIAGKDYKSIFK